MFRLYILSLCPPPYKKLFYAPFLSYFVILSLYFVKIAILWPIFCKLILFYLPMRLESIKLAGFKSFVDPTMLAFPSNLTAIVGPNGCGKSNIIDAIRWVMGESSAKQLRGQSLDDVIFNGCTTRKPLGQAAVELNFDNSDASLGGQYSSYAHIAIRREITREGHSIYSLNGTRCRRRDIRDIFLGTGLGPRSYAIIEQGMISRVVEAKPDELRTFIEEAAGISKYKERRRETEDRLAHTQENLNRLHDLREELAKQAKHLQRQAHTAERYKTLKREERLHKAHLHALRYRVLQQALQAQLHAVQETEEHVNEAHDEQQGLLKEITQQREQQKQARMQCDELQSRYYTLGNDIVRLEEKQRSHTAQFKQNQQENIALQQKRLLLTQQMQENQNTQSQLSQKMLTLNKTWDEIKETTEQNQYRLEQAEQDLKNWQAQWETLQENLAQYTQQYRITQTQQQHYQQLLQNLTKRLSQLEKEHTEQKQILRQHHRLAELDAAVHHVQEKQTAIQVEQTQTLQHINEQRELLQQCINALDADKSRLQINQGQLAALLALQQEALGQDEESLLSWLKQHKLAEYPRLAQLLQVEMGWEHAVEIALNQHIQAICCTDRNSLDDFFNHSLPESGVSLMLQSTPCSYSTATFAGQTPLPLPRLSSKLTAPWSLDNLLLGIYAADTITEALTHVQHLKGYESIITRDGICLGKHWVSLGSISSAKTGLLQREREITRLKAQQADMQQQLAQNQAKHTRIQQQLQALEERHLEKHKQLTLLISEQADLKTRYQVQNASLLQSQERTQHIQQELQENIQQIEDMQAKLHHLEQEQKLTQTQLEHIEQQRQSFLAKKTRLQAHFTEVAQKTKAGETQFHQLELSRQNVDYQLHAIQETSSRLQQQQQQLEERAIELQHMLSESEDPLQALQQQLHAQTEQQHRLAKQLQTKQSALQALEQQLQNKEQQSQRLESTLSLDREDLAQQRLQCQELRVRAKTLAEQLQEQGYALDELIQALPAAADVHDYETRLAEITQGIKQIGAVNLAALEEHQSVIERKTYLDTQHHDLSEALTILQMAIQKMDKETRSRFKETFDNINQNFTALFPRLFSGGHAVLQLQDPDLLNSGVGIMAQPPGKRNSSIQLLSGGEKALTATALVFAFFQLNPAPFCMLDEVDAPLDDTNVLKFCKLVKEMAQEVQFIFISHNKVAIEMAQHLAGITMHEPGVSRLVAVDVEKAIAMAST
jgi:chromosome segregation protein